MWLCHQVRDRLVQPLPPPAEAHPPNYDPAHPAPGAQVPTPPVCPRPGPPLPSASNVAIGDSKVSRYHSHGSPDEAHLLSWPCPYPWRSLGILAREGGADQNDMAGVQARCGARWPGAAEVLLGPADIGSLAASPPGSPGSLLWESVRCCLSAAGWCRH